MSKEEKIADRILRKRPIPNDITPKELLAFALQKGWRVKETEGSHMKFYIKKASGDEIMYPIPTGGRKTILPAYIAKIRHILEDE